MTIQYYINIQRGKKKTIICKTREWRNVSAGKKKGRKQEETSTKKLKIKEMMYALSYYSGEKRKKIIKHEKIDKRIIQHLTPVDLSTSA